MPTPTRVVWAWSAERAVHGSPERVLDRAPDGTLWFCEDILPGGGGYGAHLWYSKNQGTTWSFGGQPLIGSAVQTTWPRGFHLDAEGFLHYLIRTSNNTIVYIRGTPNATGTGFTYKTVTFTPSSDALDPNAGSDLVAFRLGGGWRVFVLVTTTAISGSTATNTLRVCRIDVAANGAITYNGSQVVRTTTGFGYPFGCLAFQHIGDGKTATATPHIYITSGVTTPNTAQHRQDPLTLHRYTYQSGAWVLDSPVTLDAATDLTGRTMRCGYDGTRVAVGYGTRNRTVGVSSAVIKLASWDEAAGTVTISTPPAYGGGYPLTTSLALDPSTDDVYLAAAGETDDDPKWVRYSRFANAWGAWASAATGDFEKRPGRFNLKQYVSASSVEGIYVTTVPYTGSNQSPYICWYVRLVNVNQPPVPPTLLQPVPSTVLDLASNGAVFSWQFVDPDPGDIQSAWQMRRKTTGAYTYYNAGSQTWGASPVWNTGAATSVAFGSGTWPNGATYQWSVNTQDSSGQQSGFAADSTVVASTAPTVTVVAPSGTYVSDSSPVVEWEFTGSAVQRTFQIRVFDRAGYSDAGFNPGTSTAVWDSGESTSNIQRSARVGAILTNGSGYRAYMQVSDTNGIYSGWAYTEFVLLLTAAPPPSVEATVEQDHVSRLPRVRLTIQGVSNMLSASQAYAHTDNDNQTSNGAVYSTDYWTAVAGVDGAATLARVADGGGDYIRQTWTAGQAAGTVGNAGLAYSLAGDPADDPLLVTNPGELVSASVWVRSSTAQRVAVSVQYVDAAVNVKQATSSEPVVLTANTWTLLTLTQMTAAPTETTRARIQIYSVSGAGAVSWPSGATFDAKQLVVTNPARRDWNPDFNCVLGTSTVGAAAGSSSVTLTAAAAGDVRAVSGPGSRPLDTTGIPALPQRDFPVTAGSVYTAVASFTAAATPRLCRVALRWYTPTDVLLSTASRTAVADMVNFPTQVSVTADAPLGADRVRVVLEVLGCAENETHHVDGIDLHPGTSTVYTPGGLVPTQKFTVYRRTPDGNSSPVRGVTAAASDPTQQMVAVDREMPFGVDVTYTGLVSSTLYGGQPLASALSAEAQVTVDADLWAVRDPLDLSAETGCYVADHTVTVEEQSAAYRPAGRALPLVESEGVNGEDGTVRIAVPTPQQRALIRQLVARPTPLLLQSPIGENWYIRCSRRIRKSTGFQSQDVNLDYVEVDAP